MSDMSSYWTRGVITRRAMVRKGAAAGGGLAALSLIGCSSGTMTATTGASGTGTRAALDSTKGKPGGKLVIQTDAHPGTLVLVKTNNATLARLAGYTHSGLLEFRNGTPAVSGGDISVAPDLAQALPEQPDPVTYVFKLKNAKFHNGRAVTSEDVKYSLERYAFGSDSAYKSTWTWLDRVETPDPQTAVIKNKSPFADALQSFAARFDAFILCREHEESPDAALKLLGSGPFLFVDTQPPVITRFRRNPDYFNKPYPYFNELHALGTSDQAKRIADFASKQTHVSYRFSEEERDQVLRSRPDAVVWGYQFAAFNLFLRTDQPPFNDARVRRALSMAIDRKTIRDAQSKGEGEIDQVFSPVSAAWGLRKVSELGEAAKYWNYDPQAAKQMLSAAGVSLPIETQMRHWDATVIGASLGDVATLTASQWRTVGIANVKDISETIGQSTTTTAAGNYDGTYVGVNAMHQGPTIGIAIRSQFFSPTEGVRVPTTNTGHINDPELSALAEKQIGQLNFEERKQTLRRMEAIMADQMYRIPYSTYGAFYFTDPIVNNAQLPRFIVNGSQGYVKYWWFG